ncbi:DUF4124 domain-containing protein [Luteibacter yeojuensis]|uniref:DUF4124 domain-containing protein n=1 Tax=Luteibacter yeojuensis TaxID=345309 RepID=A0A0F3KWC1_9GAMM|nr:DUF4124 domain-containing protein [Luteibacter yeojuensis]KJV35461.1 hypothetical protein VI08_07830 [Luteibacter yeojuensis]
MRRALAALVVATLPLGGAVAGEAYKCTANGQTIYQQTPCAKQQHQEVLQLDDSAPAPSRPVVPPPPDGVFTDVEPPAPTPPRPVPQMYLCTRATDGKTYTSSNGHPDAYAAPLGVLGAVDNGLANVYGSRNAAVSSFPELNRGKGNAAAVANANYVWVRDTCRPMSAAETCQTLRDEQGANEKAIRNAFKSERAPLDAKDAALRGQLQGCG